MYRCTCKLVLRVRRRLHPFSKSRYERHGAFAVVADERDRGDVHHRCAHARRNRGRGRGDGCGCGGIVEPQRQHKLPTWSTMHEAPTTSHTTSMTSPGCQHRRLVQTAVKGSRSRTGNFSPPPSSPPPPPATSSPSTPSSPPSPSSISHGEALVINGAGSEKRR
ncbi:hypothetical protein BD626DRAFT_572722 [Schizophyllum amplum]|uniref:Uncharacterized protein n=1 Tax=Schizophyllum amplum TaxID=97359 RepID=A0A550C3R4_9AGAR|nr:hypothetical protein BD626DRAFT_572722 [Auriculariopsis ampla]